MKCYYEVLGVSRDANDDDIKRAFRKLALQWHPDKNPNNVDEAKEQFQLVQQAYEVLSDVNERSWYDKHRESILRGRVGTNYEDKSLDVFQYFTTSCYCGFGDDEKGFYSVYREVFNVIAAEDSEFNSDLDSDDEIPNFGKTDSLFEDIVKPFYSYWESYSTKKSYAWLNVYDIKEAPNRKVVRLMEKENKKVRDKAKKTRNEEIRALVNFVKKRDKRVKAHLLFLKEKRDLNLKKSEDKRRMKLKEREEELASQKESEWSRFSNLEKDLKDIEANLAIEFGDAAESDTQLEGENSDNEEEISKDETLYCIACNKVFKTAKAFQNHENSKKHKENVSILKSNLILSENEEDDSARISISSEIVSCDNDVELNASVSGDSNDSDVENSEPDPTVDGSTETNMCMCSDTIEDQFEENKWSNNGQNKMNDKTIPSAGDSFVPNHSEDEQNQESLENFGFSKKQRKKIIQQQILLDESSGLVTKKSKRKDSTIRNHLRTQEVSACEESSALTKTKTPQKPEAEELGKEENSNLNNNIKQSTHNCIACKSTFPSKNKLFEHLKKSGHAVIKQIDNGSSSTSKKRHKGKVKL